MNNAFLKMHRTGWRLALVCICFAWSPGIAQSADEKLDDKVMLNFVGADIQSVVKTIGLITGKNFILDPRVTGTVNIVSASPVSKDVVYPIFLSALRLQGFTALEGPDVIKIVPEADAKLNYSPTTEKRTAASGDRIVTQVYPLQFENAAQLLPVLRPLISPNNVINAYPNTNTLVITDYAENVKRIDRIIASIDVPQTGDFRVIPLQYASAVDVSQLLVRLLPEAGAAPTVPGQAPRLAIATDPRTNSLVVRASDPTAINRVRTLVAGMDVPTAASGNIHVVYLRNAEATKVAESLRGILTGEAPHAGQAGQLGQPQPSLTPVGAQPTAPTQPSAAAGPAAVVQLPGGGSIQAYPASNSLIIVAPDHLYNALRGVIEKLDARRAQVFVEALVVEVTTTKAAEFGIQWQDLSGLNSTNTQVIGGTNFTTPPSTSNILNIAKNITSVGSGLSIGVIKGTVTLPDGTKILNLGALARALESDRDANILSTPNLLTIDNEEAKIVVGQNVPFITGSQTSTVGGLQAPFQTIERHDVGLTLKVKPQVAEGGSVKLTIYQEVSSISDTTNPAGIITNKRSIESTVLVDDGHIVVLGGLIQDTVNRNKDQVPILGDIPLLGYLFKYDTRNRTKTNLMVFMRPYVLRDIDSPNALTNERYDYIRGEQSQAHVPPHLILPDMPSPLLPERAAPPGAGPQSEDYEQQNSVPLASQSAPRPSGPPVSPLHPSYTPPGARQQ
jgi:general secretion pathway protein D